MQRAFVAADVTSALQKLARRHQLTLNTLLQGAWALLLSRYGGERDSLSLGPPSPAGRRTWPAPESMVGLFANTLPVRSCAAG